MRDALGMHQLYVIDKVNTQLPTPNSMADREKIVDAITKRNQKPPSASNSSTSDPVRGDVFSKGHERKQEFRRLVDPGMTRPNSREVVSEAIKVRSWPPASIVARAGKKG